MEIIQYKLTNTKTKDQEKLTHVVMFIIFVFFHSTN